MAKTAVLINISLVLSLLFFVSMAEGKRFTNQFQFTKAAPASVTIACTDVYGIESGDTCFAVQQNFKLTPKDFSTINPNLICEQLFVGQWVCVAGGRVA